MSVEKGTSDDEIYCNTIGESISDIIRFSLDEEFRKSSFELFGVSSTKEIEEEISKRLLSLTRNENKTPKSDKKMSKKRCRDLLDEREKENQQESKELSSKKKTNLSPNANMGNNSTTPQNFFQRNWLQISSQQYRNIIKRRKLNYFSQPQLNQANQNDFKFLNYNSYFSNSQPTFSDEGFNLLSDLIDDKLNYCQKMFKKSFTDTESNYFKRDFKFYK